MEWHASPRRSTPFQLTCQSSARTAQFEPRAGLHLIDAYGPKWASLSDIACPRQQGEYSFVREPRPYLVLWGPRLATHSRQADPRVRYRGKLQCCWRTESAAQSAMPIWRQPVYWHQPSRSSHRSSMNTPCCREVLRTMARCTFRSRAALKPNSSSRKRWRCCIPSTSRRPEELSRRSPRRSPIALWPGGGLRSASA